MKLANVVRHFSKEKVFDAYTGAYLFSGHMLAPAAHVSGDTFRRHTMSTVDGITPPARGAVSVLGDYWLIGNSNPDGFKGSVVRRNHSLKKSSGLLNLLTPAQACLSATGLPMHVYKEYYRDTTNAQSDAEFSTMWSLHCSINEATAEGSFFRDGASLLRVRNIYPIQEGFNIAETDVLDPDALQPVTFTSTGKVDLVTDLPTAMSVMTTVIQTDSSKFYVFATEAQDPRKPGDRTVFVAKSALTPAQGMTFRMLGQVWRVLALTSERDAWALHARLA